MTVKGIMIILELLSNYQGVGAALSVKAKTALQLLFYYNSLRRKWEVVNGVKAENFQNL